MADNYFHEKESLIILIHMKCQNINEVTTGKVTFQNYLELCLKLLIQCLVVGAVQGGLQINKKYGFAIDIHMKYQIIMIIKKKQTSCTVLHHINKI